MAVQHLFDSSGRWIAFRRSVDDKYVFDSQGRWIGWLPWDNLDVVDRQGRYMASIFEGERLYRVVMPKLRGYPGYPGFPGFPGYPGFPPLKPPKLRPLGTEDIDL